MIDNGKINIILISGKAGSGKSTFSKFLSHNLMGGSLIYSFASEVKHTAINLGWDGKKDSRGRKLLQSLATVFREYDKNIWANLVRNEILSAIFPRDIIIIPDWRYANEVDIFRNDPLFKVHTMRITGRSEDLGENALHVSEVSLSDDDEYDFVVDNINGMQELKEISYAISCELLGVTDAK